jgi:hypothetical protein
VRRSSTLPLRRGGRRSGPAGRVLTGHAETHESRGDRAPGAPIRASNASEPHRPARSPGGRRSVTRASRSPTTVRIRRAAQ